MAGLGLAAFGGGALLGNAKLDQMAGSGAGIVHNEAMNVRFSASPAEQATFVDPMIKASQDGLKSPSWRSSTIDAMQAASVAMIDKNAAPSLRLEKAISAAMKQYPDRGRVLSVDDRKPDAGWWGSSVNDMRGASAMRTKPDGSVYFAQATTPITSMTVTLPKFAAPKMPRP